MGPQFGRTIIGVGIALVLVGLLAKYGLLGWLGKLPGDIRIQRENFSFYFPLTTCLVISVLLTLALRLFGRR